MLFAFTRLVSKTAATLSCRAVETGAGLFVRCVRSLLPVRGVGPDVSGGVKVVLVAGFVVVKFRSGVVAVGVVALAASLAGCAGDGVIAENALSLDPFTTPHGAYASMETGALPETAKHVAEGKLQFSNGHYGKAIDAYSKSIELDALNAQAWLGLAASYDQVGRFDQADKAYGKAQQLMGSTPSVLNNLGYSYLLRGNLDKSRATLAAAYHGDPGNPYILNNIEILNERLVALGHPPMVMN